MHHCAKEFTWMERPNSLTYLDFPTALSPKHITFTDESLLFLSLASFSWFTTTSLAAIFIPNVAIPVMPHDYHASLKPRFGRLLLGNRLSSCLLLVKLKIVRSFLIALCDKQITTRTAFEFAWKWLIEFTYGKFGGRKDFKPTCQCFSRTQHRREANINSPAKKII